MNGLIISHNLSIPAVSLSLVLVSKGKIGEEIYCQFKKYSATLYFIFSMLIVSMLLGDRCQTEKTISNFAILFQPLPTKKSALRHLTCGYII